MRMILNRRAAAGDRPVTNLQVVDLRTINRALPELCNLRIRGLTR
jgi:hypothetical protein